MAPPFDPYHTWLGIAPDEQPADHYRLLGIQRFEGNADVIHNAADRQMAHLKTFQTGRRVAECQQLLNEVSAAAASLLDPAREAAYDASIQPAPVAPPIMRSVARARPKAYPVGTMVQIVLGGAVGLFVAVLTLNYFWGIDLLGKAKTIDAVARAEKPKPPSPTLGKPAIPERGLPVPKAPEADPRKPEPSPKPEPPAPAPIPPELAPPAVAPKTTPMGDNTHPMLPATPVVSPTELTGDNLTLYNTYIDALQHPQLELWR